MKLVVTEFMTLDGVVESPHEWSFAFWNDEAGKFKHQETMNSDALLLGRVTYEGFAEAWPSRKDPDGFADKFNSMPKYVASTTLKDPKWNNSHVLHGDVVKEIEKLKRKPGKDLTIHGSPTLVRSLLPHKLIDEFHLLVYPIVLGRGKKLFDDNSMADLELAESKTYGTGVVQLIYRRGEKKKQPAKPPA